MDTRPLPDHQTTTLRLLTNNSADVTEEVRLEEQLARLAAENEALVENSLDIMALLDHEGRYLRVSEAVTDILGYLPEELLGRRYAELLHPDDLDKVQAADAGLRNGKNTIQDLQARWIHKNGGIVYLSSAVRWSAARKLMYGTSRDITERYRAQAELQKSRDQLNAMLESIGDAFFTVDRDWRLTYANLKAAEFARISRDASIGKVLWDAVPEILDSSVMRYYRQAMETRQDTFFDAYYEPADAWVEVRAYPHEDGLAVYFHDITERRNAEIAMRESEQRFSDAIEMTPAGYLLIDAEGNLVDVNPALCRMSGYAREDLIGQDMTLLFPAFRWSDALFAQTGVRAVHGKESVIRHRTGREVHVLVNLSVNRHRDGRASLTAFLTDITERKQAEARLELLATHDTLTGLPNRALLHERLQQMMDDAATANAPVAVLFIDLDRFKEVNDSMGHNRGDILLREVAHRLRKSVRPDDIVARLGGDEFVVGAQCSRGRASAEALVRKLLATLAAPFDIGGQEVFVCASIGISLFPQDGQTRELLFQNADTAMYRAKAAGRNGYRFFEAAMSVEAKTRMTLEHSLRRALEREEFELHYQPRIDLKTMTVVGMEALIRWNHPQLGQVPPLQFVPIAEETGLIAPIGTWVLEQACRQTRRLMQKFGLPLRVSVNLSARQLKCDDIVAQVQACLQDARLPAHLLELELTESALIDDMEASVEALKALKKLGIMLSVDDFGTGYSGLAYLRSFPLDTLKLDRSFVTPHNDRIGNFKFIKAFVDLAHTLNLSVLAEGVENGETLQLLQDAACDEAQGFFLAKPLTLDDFEAFLAGLSGCRVQAKAL